MDRLVNAAHPAFTQPLQNLVRAEEKALGMATRQKAGLIFRHIVVGH